MSAPSTDHMYADPDLIPMLQIVTCNSQQDRVEAWVAHDTTTVETNLENCCAIREMGHKAREGLVPVFLGLSAQFMSGPCDDDISIRIELDAHVGFSNRHKVSTPSGEISLKIRRYSGCISTPSYERVRNSVCLVCNKEKRCPENCTAGRFLDTNQADGKGVLDRAMAAASNSAGVR